MTNPVMRRGLLLRRLLAKGLSGAVQIGTSSRGSAVLRRVPGVNFPDKVDFHYEGSTPLVYVPEKCGEFLCQLRGRAKPLPAARDIIFGGEYEEAARAKLLVNSSVPLIFILFYSSTLVSYNFLCVACAGGWHDEYHD